MHPVCEIPCAEMRVWGGESSNGIGIASAWRHLPAGAAFNTSYCSERERPEEISFPCLSVMCFL